jgi:hypothetical protein
VSAFPFGCTERNRACRHSPEATILAAPASPAVAVHGPHGAGQGVGFSIRLHREKPGLPSLPLAPGFGCADFPPLRFPALKAQAITPAFPSGGPERFGRSGTHQPSRFRLLRSPPALRFRCSETEPVPRDCCPEHPKRTGPADLPLPPVCRMRRLPLRLRFSVLMERARVSAFPSGPSEENRACRLILRLPFIGWSGHCEAAVQRAYGAWIRDCIGLA